MKRNEDISKRTLGHFKCTNICVIEMPEEEREKGPEKIFEEMIAIKFLNIGKNHSLKSRMHNEYQTE